jgi:hypothetical protein
MVGSWRKLERRITGKRGFRSRREEKGGELMTQNISEKNRVT